MLNKLVCIIMLLGSLSITSLAQELNCRITVISEGLQSADPLVFKTLENDIFEFMNNRKWTNNYYKENERIECTMLINITGELGSDIYRATVTIQSSRPVYKSSYNTVMLNFADKDWVFEYAQYQVLEFSENSYLSNLTSLLAYYANVIIGLDKDAFSLKQGQRNFEKAEQIMNNVPGSLGDNAPGWKPFDGQINRYWLVENLLSPQFQSMREVFYQYHLQGLDKMYENDKTGRAVILSSLKKLELLAQQKPNSMLMAVFFDAKSDELVQLFKGASPNEKTEAINLLRKLDPGNAPDYLKITK